MFQLSFLLSSYSFLIVYGSTLPEVVKLENGNLMQGCQFDPPNTDFFLTFSRKVIV